MTKAQTNINLVHFGRKYEEKYNNGGKKKGDRVKHVMIGFRSTIQKRYKTLYGVDLSDATIISEGKRCCLTYDKNKTNKGERGVFVGLKLKTKEKSTIEDDLDSED